MCAMIAEDIAGTVMQMESWLNANKPAVFTKMEAVSAQVQASKVRDQSLPIPVKHQGLAGYM